MLDLNLENYWMPYTDNSYYKANPRMLVKAKGLYYEDHTGKKLLDACSGLWCSNLGHGREEITKAVAEQLQTLDYAPTFQLGSPNAFKLASRISKQLPEPLNKVFFTNSGSESVDTAVKIALAYHKFNGQPQRQRLIGREKAYHGSGIAGVALGGIVNNRRHYGNLLPATDHISHTINIERNAFSKQQPEWGDHLADDLDKLAELHGGETIAAVIVEPVAGSIGVVPPPKGYLQRLREICDKHGILLIFDEVITGFGRLGAAFAAQYFGVTPDIITMAKGLTNGAMPMGAVGVKQSIYDTFINNNPSGIELFHGYTYSGHCVSAAAGLATLDIYEQEDMYSKAGALASVLEEAVFTLKDAPHVIDIRNLGLMAGIQLKPADNQIGQRGKAVFEYCFDNGVVVRFNGDCIALAPAYVSEPTDIETMVNCIKTALHKIK